MMQKRLGPSTSWLKECHGRLRRKAEAKDKADHDYREELRRYLALLRVKREERRKHQ